MKLHLTFLSIAVAGLAYAAPTNEPTVVTSDRMQWDYLQNFGTFEGNVLVIDPRLTVRADKMLVYFATGTTNTARSVDRIIATGAVVINQDQKKATGDRAEYTATNDQVTITGTPKVESPDGVVTGKKITFRRGQSQMDVETDAADTNRTRLIIYPEDQRKKEE